MIARVRSRQLTTTMSSGASAGQLIGALGAFFAAGGVCFYATNVANVFGGVLPGTVNNAEWEAAAKARRQACEREGSSKPIKLDPMQ